MTTLIMAEVELFGAYAGANIVLSGHQFVNGKTTIADVEQYKINQAARLFSYFDGYVVGSPEWQIRKKDADGIHDSESGKKRPGSLSGNGTGGGDKSSAIDVPHGEGHDRVSEASPVQPGATGSGAPSRYDPSQIKKLADAIKKLNPEVDDHWTDGGLPRLKALEAAGFHSVSREAVELAASGWTREKALAESV